MIHVSVMWGRMVRERGKVRKENRDEDCNQQTNLSLCAGGTVPLAARLRESRARAKSSGSESDAGTKSIPRPIFTSPIFANSDSSKPDSSKPAAN